MIDSKKFVSRHLSVAMLAAIGFATPCLADDYPAGVACDFALRVEPAPGHGADFKPFFDRDGNLVKILITGTSPTLAVSNVDNGNATTFASKGQMIKITPNADGTTSYAVQGHTLIIYWGADELGPGAVYYIGRVTLVVDAGGAFTSIRARGVEIDVCEMLE